MLGRPHPPEGMGNITARTPIHNPCPDLVLWLSSFILSVNKLESINQEEEQKTQS